MERAAMRLTALVGYRGAGARCFGVGGRQPAGRLVQLGVFVQVFSGQATRLKSGRCIGQGASGDCRCSNSAWFPAIRFPTFGLVSV